ncbi:unnamed protein product [Pylaiella littoralis]
MVCVNPILCKEQPVRYLMGTRSQLYDTVMEDLRQAHEAGEVEVDRIGNTYFTNSLIPFYVLEQSLRSCICVHCYKAKLITKALCVLWPTLHRGDTPSSPCTCGCDLCKDGACSKYLPYDSSASVHSMANFSDMHLCAKERLYVSKDGTSIEAHKSACVSGHCLHCQRKQDRFFECPRNKGGLQRQVQPAVSTTPATDATDEPPPGEIRWKIFTNVDSRGMATTATSSQRRGRRETAGDDDDDDYNPNGGGNQTRSRNAVAEKKGSVDDFMLELRGIFNRFTKHRRQYKTQRIAFNELKLTIQDGEVLCVVDFQERLQLQDQDEVQSQHWGKLATTIFPCAIFFRCDGRVWVYSFQILSDDMTQDNAWVQYVMTKLLSDDIPALLRRVGAEPMERATIFTDNCAKQFKCRFHFGWVADADIGALDKRGDATGKRVHLEHHYFGACHGKNVSDSEGAITKEYARQMVTNTRWTVASSEDLCKKLAKALNFLLRPATSEERDAFVMERGGRTGGTEQLLMTKASYSGRGTQPATYTFLLTKLANSVLGRDYQFVRADQVSESFRNSARSSAKAIEVAGCQTASKIIATNTPGVIATYEFSCFCGECLEHRTENCPLVRKGIMEGPKEFARRVGHVNDDLLSAEEQDLTEMFERMKGDLPFGSTALLRVDSSDHCGEDIVPVLLARKAPSIWSPDYSADGMFTHGDWMVWVVDLQQVSERRERVEYIVPNDISSKEQFRAVPLTCIAGLGQGISGYMERSPYPLVCEDSTHFVMRDGVLENARSSVVLMSTSPSSAFKGFSPVGLTEEELTRATVASPRFSLGTEVERAFKGPVRENRSRVWRTAKRLTARVVDMMTDDKSRRHRYKLRWDADRTTKLLAGVQNIVDEGFVEKYVL